MRVSKDTCIRGLFLYATLVALYVLKEVFIPFTLALVAFLLLSPLVKRLSKVGIKRSISAALLVLALIAGVAVLASQVVEPAEQWSARFPQLLSKVESQLSAYREPFNKISRSAERIESFTEVDGGTQAVYAKKVSIIGTFFSEGQIVLVRSLVVLLLLFFLLAYGEDLGKNLSNWVGSETERRRLSKLYSSLSSSISTYLVTITAINAGLSLAIGFAMYAIGLPNATLWGVMAGTLNFIPYFGVLAGGLIVSLVAVATFGSLLQMALVPIVYFGISAVEGSLITPLILGSRFSLNPIIMLLWLMFCGFMWGIPGAFLAVPLLIAIKLTAERPSEVVVSVEAAKLHTLSEPEAL